MKSAGVTVASTTESQEGLHRGLTRWHALAIVVGSVLGTGIYMRPASIAQLVGSPSLIITVWIGAGLLSLAGALTYAELAARIPRSGGAVAIIAFACLGATLAVLGSYDRLSDIAAFGYILFYALNAAGLVSWRRGGPKGDGFTQRRRNWVPVAFLGGMLGLIATLIVRGNVEILAALAVIGAGLPVFAYLRYRRDHGPSA
jgi:amino acid transporter